MTWLIRTFGRSFVWKLGALAAIFAVGVLKTCYAQTIDCANPCTVTIVHDFVLQPLQIDLEGGAQIAGAILAVWAVGWGARVVIRALNVDSNSTSESEK